MLTLKEIHKAVGGILVVSDVRMPKKSSKLDAFRQSMIRIKYNLELDPTVRKYAIKFIKDILIPDAKKTESKDIAKEAKLTPKQLGLYTARLVVQTVDTAEKMALSKLKFEKTKKNR